MYNLIYKRISKSYFLLMAIWLLFGHGLANAQEAATIEAPELSGMVVDQYGKPVAGVEITVKTTNAQRLSGEDGTFSLESIYGATLVLSHPDFIVKEIKVPHSLKKNAKFRVAMTDKKLKNPETIDLPYRGSIDKDSYLGAASTIYSDEIASHLSSNILGAMVGRVSGLNITQTRGFKSIATGAASSSSAYDGWVVDLGRGFYSDNSQYSASLRGAASPLIIVDGLENDLSNLDVESIESISVQKDALSSLFLGGRSSRGVMYVTTKKPVADGFKVSFTGRYGLQEPIKTPKPLSTTNYAYLLNEALVNDGAGTLYSTSDIQKFASGSDPYTHPSVNWYDQVLKNSSAIQSYNLNAMGGGKTAQYFVSLGYMSEDGLFKQASDQGYDTNSKYERYMITSKINVNILDNLKMTATVIGRIEDEREPGASGGELLNELYRLPNIAYPVRNGDENETFGGVNGYGQRNLLAQTTHSGYKMADARDGAGTINLDHNMAWLTDGLSARVVGSVASQSRSAIERVKQQAVYQYTPGVGTELFGQQRDQNNSYLGVYNFQYMYGLTAFDYEKTINKDHNISGTFSADLKEVLDNYQLPERLANIYLEGKYDYKKKYFAQAAINRSYLNRFGPGHRWGTFYAFGLGWDISKEDFLTDVEWINKLKFRTVFGETGNGIGRDQYYTWRQQYAGGIDDLHGAHYPQGSAYISWYNTPALGLVERNITLANPNLSWERAHKLNIGLDANLFNNRLWFSADFYHDYYFDMLMQRGKNIELIGLNYPLENVGEYLQTGVDLSATYQNNAGNFNYYVTANWSINKSEIKFIDEQDVPEEYMRMTGRSTFAGRGLVADGFFESQEDIANSAVITGMTPMPGDLKYKDLNNDGVINEFDQTVISNDKPISTFGLNLGFEFKGFEVSALFQGAYNRDINLMSAGTEFVMGFQADRNGYNQAYEHIMARWTPETANTALFPRLTTRSSYSTSPNNWGNSFWVRSGNYIRLKNLSVAYTLPDSFARNYLGGAKVKLFITGQNLWTQAACDLVDPEIVRFTNYPMMKGFNTGINIKF